MLTRVELTPEQCDILRDALNNEGDGRLDLEMSVNIVNTVNSFLAVRYLPLPRLDAHLNIPGEERDYDMALFKATDGYVLFQQASRDCENVIARPYTMETNFVIGSTLDFMPEDRTTGWPLRVREIMLEVVQWQLEQSRVLSVEEKAKFRLWREMENPQSDMDFFDKDLDGVRQVLAGKDTTQNLWKSWARDEVKANRQFASCREMGQMMQNLFERSTAKRGP
jgi:hypothetical protein